MTAEQPTNFPLPCGCFELALIIRKDNQFIQPNPSNPGSNRLFLNNCLDRGLKDSLGWTFDNDWTGEEDEIFEKAKTANQVNDCKPLLLRELGMDRHPSKKPENR